MQKEFKMNAKIYKTVCTQCPSAYYPADPECEQIMKYPKEEQLKTVFNCAWRQNKLCKGYCDLMGISEADFNGDEDGKSRSV